MLHQPLSLGLCSLGVLVHCLELLLVIGKERFFFRNFSFQKVGTILDCSQACLKVPLHILSQQCSSATVLMSLVRVHRAQIRSQSSSHW